MQKVEFKTITLDNGTIAYKPVRDSDRETVKAFASKYRGLFHDRSYEGYLLLEDFDCLFQHLGDWGYPVVNGIEPSVRLELNTIKKNGDNENTNGCLYQAWIGLKNLYVLKGYLLRDKAEFALSCPIQDAIA